MVCHGWFSVSCLFELFSQVLEMVVNWLNCDWESRRIHTASILSLVRLGLVPEPALKELISDDMHAIPEVQDILDLVHREKQSTASMTELEQQHPKYFTLRSTITVS